MNISVSYLLATEGALLAIAHFSVSPAEPSVRGTGRVRAGLGQSSCELYCVLGDGPSQLQLLSKRILSLCSQPATGSWIMSQQFQILIIITKLYDDTLCPFMN